jgi:cytochrome c oxidase subunit IV
MSKKSNVKISTNRNFGLVFFIFFLIIGFWPLINMQEVRTWSLLLAIPFLILGLINSKLLTPLNLLWSRLGILLGSIIAPIVMAFVFFLVVTPTSFFMKLLGKDLLNKKYNKNEKSYWIKRKNLKSSMRNQF